MRVLGDLRSRVTGIIDEDLLRSDEDANCSFETLDIEYPILALELHQVQRGEVASGVIEENIFRAGISGMNRLGAFARVPFLDCAIVLQAGVAADPGAFGDLIEESAGVFFL